MEPLAQILKNNLGEKVLDCNTELQKCPKCGDFIQKRVNILNKEMVVPIICRCRKAENEQKKIEEENKEKQIRLQQLIRNSLMDRDFMEKTFANWDYNLGSKKFHKIAAEYFKNFKTMKNKNYGLLLYGSPGNGKTYTAACIANELMKKYVPVICVSSDGLLSRIKETYSKWGKEAEVEVLLSLANADLLIIDDLGAENITEWSVSKVYNIIDSRYRNKLPLIVTTNKSLKELEEIYNKRTFDRLLEMCIPIENRESSIRVVKSKEKTLKLKELFNL